MKASELVRAMVDGLEKRWVNLEMSTFGEFHKENGKFVCYGCAATNTICEILGKTISLRHSKKYSEYPNVRDVDMSALAKASEGFVFGFEVAIDSLRKGGIEVYNKQAERLGIATIPKQRFKLPYLRTHYTEQHLAKYRKLIKSLEAYELRNPIR